MKNFSFANPVKIIFGKDTIGQISNEIAHGSKVLVVYGGGSIKRNGVFDQVIQALEGCTTYEFPGIEPNPHYETCMQAVAMVRSEGIDFLLAVGGGSVIDAVKFIAAAVCFEGGDPWDILAKEAMIERAIPFGTVLTLPATGSEMNPNSVITREGTKEKLSFGSAAVFPKFSVLDPTTTYTLPRRQVGNGIVDAFVHVVEQYLTFYNGNSLLQDKLAEGILKTLVSEGPKALADPTDYDVRANLMWASTWALNGWIGQGVPQDWSTHMIGHEITAYYGLDHAQTLAIVLPGVLTVLQSLKSKKILSLGREVFGIQQPDEQMAILTTIREVERFFEQVGVKTHLGDYGLGDEVINKVVRRMTERQWLLGECRIMTPEMIRDILTLRK